MTLRTSAIILRSEESHVCAEGFSGYMEQEKESVRFMVALGGSSGGSSLDAGIHFCKRY